MRGGLLEERIERKFRKKILLQNPIFWKSSMVVVRVDKKITGWYQECWYKPMSFRKPHERTMVEESVGACQGGNWVAGSWGRFWGDSRWVAGRK